MPIRFLTLDDVDDAAEQGANESLHRRLVEQSLHSARANSLLNIMEVPSAANLDPEPVCQCLLALAAEIFCILRCSSPATRSSCAPSTRC